MPAYRLSQQCARLFAAGALGLTVAVSASAQTVAPAQTPPAAPPKATPQPRPHGSRVPVDPTTVVIDDGDTVVIRWPSGGEEIVRLLGIDCPETRHPEHDLPYGQAFGEEARAFARGAFAGTPRLELLRAAMLDPFGRTLGYMFINGRNYSSLVIQARLAQESVTQFGDNGLPAEAAEVMEAAKQQGPLPFEPPSTYRGRMRELSRWLKARGEYPTQ